MQGRLLQRWEDRPARGQYEWERKISRTVTYTFCFYAFRLERSVRVKTRPAMGEYNDGAERAFDRSEQGLPVSDAPALSSVLLDLKIVKNSSCGG